MEISVFIREYAPLAGEAGRAFRIGPVDGAVAPLATFPDLPGR